MRRRRTGALLVGLGLVVALPLLQLGTPASAAGSGLPKLVEQDVQRDLKWHGGEPEIAVNPRNPKNLVMVWAAMKVIKDLGEVIYPSGAAQFAQTATGSSVVNCQIAYTFDRGTTWYPTRFPYADQPSCGDPMVVAGQDGSFYVAMDSMGDWQTPNLQGGTPKDHITVTRSTDGGRSFSEPVDAHTIVDRPFFRIDPTTDYLYESSGGGLNAYPREMSMSKDKGKTWSAPRAFAGNHMAVNRGQLAYASQGGSPAQLMFALSKDEGRTYASTPVTGAVGGSGDWITADPAHAGTFSVMQQVANTLQVFTTRDSGKTWSRAFNLSNDPSRVLTKPWIDYGSTGVLGVMWKSTTADGNHHDVYLALSKDRGASFLALIKVNNAPSPIAPITYLAGDDLSWVTLDANYAYVGWGDMRSGDLQAWAARYEFNAPKASSAGAAPGLGQVPRGLPTTGTSGAAAAVALALIAAGVGLHRRRRA